MGSSSATNRPHRSTRPTPSLLQETPICLPGSSIQTKCHTTVNTTHSKWTADIRARFRVVYYYRICRFRLKVLLRLPAAVTHVEKHSIWELIDTSWV